MSAKIWIQEEYVNATEGYRIGDSGVQESRFEVGTAKKEILKFLMREFGRISGKVYIGENKPIGYVFQKKVKYEDCNETFLQETWITFHKGPEKRKVEYDYLED